VIQRVGLGRDPIEFIVDLPVYHTERAQSVGGNSVCRTGALNRWKVRRSPDRVIDSVRGEIPMVPSLAAVQRRGEPCRVFFSID
jgi:hypothetical protein